MDRNKKLIIGFYAGGLRFHGDSIKTGSIGGSETALLYMAKELAARGHDVKVFCNCDKPGRYERVDYYDYQEAWREISAIAEWDVFIASRDYRLLAQKLHSKLNVLWNHDIATDQVQIMTNIWATDIVLCNSQFHVDQWLSVAKNLRPIIHKTRNGIDLQLIDSVKKKVEGTERNKKQFLWGSRPERGMDVLLQKTWPKILKEVGEDCNLVITGYSDEGLPIPEQLKLFYAQMQSLIATTPNVKYIGPSSKEKWYELLCTSGFLIYPTYFPEISCINALEAQACELPIITSNEFALRETVKDKNNLIDGHPKSEEYQNKFVSRVKRLSMNNFEYKRSQTIGREHVIQHYEWRTIAGEWEDLFWQKFEERSYRNGGRNSLKRFVYNSDLLAARWALQHPEISGVNLAECESVNKEVEFFLTHHDENPELYNDENDITDKNDAWENVGRFKVVARHIKERFQDSEFSLVDVGCGAGGFLAHVMKLCSGKVSVQGMDFSKGLIERAGNLLLKLYPTIGNPKDFLYPTDFLQMDIPKVEDRADCIFAGEWLEHQLDIHGALSRLESWVKKDGFAIISIPNGPWEAISFRKDIAIRHHVSHFEFRDIEEIFRNKDFKMEYFPSSVSPIDNSLLGNWIIAWKVDHKPFGTIDYQRKFTTIRPYQTISCCMIVKDEEDNLSRCLKSIRMIMDEIIIADTGSTDATVGIAEKFADKVVTVPWTDDFSEARNASIAVAHPESDWIYWMDADEILIQPNRLRKYLDSELFNGYVITQNHLILDMPNVKPDVPVRIYKNNKSIKFFGAIHEHCEFALDVPIDPVLILPDVKIVHFGYYIEGIRRGKVKFRNLELLKKDREKYPDRLLGIVLMMRDYLNVSQWETDEARGQISTRVAGFLREVVRLHRKFFADDKHLYHEMSFALHQRALSALGRGNIPITDEHDDIPFEIRYALGGAFGGLEDPGRVKIDSVWFGSRDEFIEFTNSKSKALMDGLKLNYTDFIPDKSRR